MGAGEEGQEQKVLEQKKKKISGRDPRLPAYGTVNWSQFCTNSGGKRQTLKAGEASIKNHKPVSAVTGCPPRRRHPSPNLTSSPEVSTSSFINKAKYKRTRPPNDPAD